jgi:hypothetical protein
MQSGSAFLPRRSLDRDTSQNESLRMSAPSRSQGNVALLPEAGRLTKPRDHPRIINYRLTMRVNWHGAFLALSARLHAPPPPQAILIGDKSAARRVTLEKLTIFAGRYLALYQ